MTTNEQGSTTLQNGEGAVSEEVTRLQGLLEQTTAERDKLRVSNRELKLSSNGATSLQQQLDTLLAEKSTLVEEFTGFKNGIRQEKLGALLSTALEAAGATSLSATKKLLDMTKIEFGDDGNVKLDSLTAAIQELKKAEPVLFKEAEADPKGVTSTSTSGGGQEPPGKAAAQGKDAKSSYETEIRAAKSVKEIEAVMKKYSKA
jgi:hypothetical protein